MRLPWMRLPLRPKLTPRLVLQMVLMSRVALALLALLLVLLLVLLVLLLALVLLVVLVLVVREAAAARRHLCFPRGGRGPLSPSLLQSHPCPPLPLLVPSPLDQAVRVMRLLHLQHYQPQRCQPQRCRRGSLCGRSHSRPCLGLCPTLLLLLLLLLLSCHQSRLPLLLPPLLV